jgi:hypothetical protein
VELLRKQKEELQASVTVAASATAEKAALTQEATALRTAKQVRTTAARFKNFLVDRSKSIRNSLGSAILSIQNPNPRYTRRRPSVRRPPPSAPPSRYAPRLL